MIAFRIQAIVDNCTRPAKEPLATEAGLSYWIEYGDKNLLFDTGHKEAIQKNLPLLNRKLNQIDGIILSHGHYDHTGGMTWVMEELNKDIPIYAKASVTDPVWSERITGMAYAGTDPEILAPIQKNLHAIESVEEIMPGFFLVPRASQRFPQPESSKFLFEGEEGHLLPDSFRNECFVVVQRPEGIVVLSGCSHQGIANIVDKAQTLFPNQPVVSVIGGFHLQGRKPDFKERPETIDAVARFLQRQVVGTIHTGHCTSVPGFERLQTILGDQVDYFYAGDVLEL
ncbi:MBL fold metallo-hydrolase [Gottschalkiaceae bacterium SANA]|nr:MBL fold metallo-hydrolase [Gottschalkiaceae bacterium SANA]